MRGRHLVFLALPVVLLLLLLLVRPHRTGIERGMVLGPEQLKVLKTWASYRYIPIEHTEAFQSSLHSIRITNDADEANEQLRNSLIEAILTFLYAYHDGTWDAFARFAIPVTNLLPNPVRFPVRVQTFRTLKARLKVQGLPATSEDDAISVLRGLWELCNGPYDRTPLGTDADYFRTDFVEAIALEQSSAHILTGTTPPSFLPSNSDGIGYFHDSSSFTFIPSVSALVHQDGAVRFATVRLQLRTRSDPPMPVIISYYWVPEHGKWLPLKLGIPYSLRRYHGFLF